MFIKTAEKNDVKNVRLLGIKQIHLCEAVANLSFKPEKDNEIWIFYVAGKYVTLTIWKQDENDTWNFESKKVNFEANKELTMRTLQNFKSKIKDRENLCYINVYANAIILANMRNKRKFEIVFSDCYSKIRYCSLKKVSDGIMYYARFMAGEEQFLKCKCEVILENSLTITKGITDNIIFSIDHTAVKTVLPFSKIVHFDVLKEKHLKVNENIFNKSNIAVEERGHHELLINIDMNNIYNISVEPVHSCGPNLLIFTIPKKLNDYEPILDAVGIDLGTTESCLAVIRKHGPDFVQMDLATYDRSMPSFIAYDEEKPKFGQIVIDRLKHKSKFSVYDVKRFIGKSYEKVIVDPLWPFKVLSENSRVLIEVETHNGKETKSCEQITGDLLKHTKDSAQSYQGNIVTEAVIAIPSDFNERQKRATKLAAEYAGFKTIRFIPEPVAAALAYITETPILEASNVLVFDCGGGTVDICVAKVLENKFKVLCYDGDSYLGGRDFDNLLFAYFSATLKHKYYIDVMQNYKKYVLKKKCHEIKHTLSTAEEDWLHVSDFDSEHDDTIVITRKQFEEMSSDLVLRFKNVVIRSLAKADLQSNEIKHVFQVGGGCRMPLIKEMLKEEFPTSVHQCSLYPDWVVAHGAALYLYDLKTRIVEKGETDILSSEPSVFTRLLKTIRNLF